MKEWAVRGCAWRGVGLPVPSGVLAGVGFALAEAVGLGAASTRVKEYQPEVENGTNGGLSACTNARPG